MLEFVDSRPDVVRSPTQRALFDYWQRLRGTRGLPLWVGIDGGELSKAAHNLTYLDIVATVNGARFLIRFHGTAIAETYGAHCRGKFLDEVLPAPLRDRALDTYRHVVESRQPVYSVVETRDRAGRLVHYQRLLLPFGTDGKTVDRVLASLETSSPDRTFTRQDLMKSLDAPAIFSVCATIPAAL